ncbi:hypothetical protein B566_EDAN008887 [Ephemera danica]|nr:hypothetical protein B566_EDAN008887 [Ephemera danica]
MIDTNHLIALLLYYIHTTNFAIANLPLDKYSTHLYLVFMCLKAIMCMYIHTNSYVIISLEIPQLKFKKKINIFYITFFFTFIVFGMCLKRQIIFHLGIEHMKMYYFQMCWQEMGKIPSKNFNFYKMTNFFFNQQTARCMLENLPFVKNIIEKVSKKIISKN